MLERDPGDLLPTPELRKNYLSFTENLAQAIGGVGPSAGVALSIPWAFATAGNSTWLIFVVALIAFLLIGINFSEFASRTASPGAIYHYAELAFGRTAGLAAGWTYVFALLFSTCSPALVFAHYAIVLCRLIPGLSAIPHAAFVFLGVGVLVPCWISCRNVRLSSNLVLVMECVSIGFMLVLAAVFFSRSPGMDLPQLKLTGATWNGFRTGSVLAFFNFTGFESATAFGGESKKALQSIPRAIMSSLVPAGLLFIVMSYVLVASFRGYTPRLDQSEAPFDHLAALCGMPFFGHLINVGILMSFFACTLALLNASARVLYSIAQKGYFWRRVGVAHEANSTPHRAILILSVVVLGVPALLMLFGSSLDDTINNVSQLGSFGFMLSYLFICLGAPVYLRDQGVLRPRHVAVAVAATGVIFIPLFSFFSPVPAAPLRYFPYLFVVLVLATTLLSWRSRKPGTPAPEARTE
jgi:amino acid transporter